jgi:serine/threonine protein kinase
VSKAALDFLQRLLVKDVTQRMTAEQALLHPWLTEDAPDSGGSRGAGAGRTFGLLRSHHTRRWMV